MYQRCTKDTSNVPKVPKMYLQYLIVFDVSFLYLTHALTIHVPKMYPGVSYISGVPNVYQ